MQRRCELGPAAVTLYSSDGSHVCTGSGRVCTRDANRPVPAMPFAVGRPEPLSHLQHDQMWGGERSGACAAVLRVLHVTELHPLSLKVLYC